MHGSRSYFALHNLIIHAYKFLIAGVDWHEHLEEPKMNPLRFAQNWLSYRRTINELGNLSNQALNDIGLTRYDIRNVAARSFR